MILRGGPGKILLPDGKEIDVIFEPMEVKLDLNGDTLATYRLEPFDGKVTTLVTEPIDGLEFGTG
jgi:hypothetical protein